MVIKKSNKKNTTQKAMQKEKEKSNLLVKNKKVIFEIENYFSSLEDPRIERTKRHLLIDIIGLTLCAVIGGCNSWVEVELFGKSKYSWLKNYLSFPNGIPSHDTIGRVFSALDAKEFEKCFINWMRIVVKDIKNVIAIDGKSICGSSQRRLGKKAIHMVSAFSCAHKLVLGQIKTEEKSNEITAIPELLKVIDVKDSIVTIDAMGCQKAIAKRILTGGERNGVSPRNAKRIDMRDRIQ